MIGIGNTILKLVDPWKKILREQYGKYWKSNTWKLTTFSREKETVENEWIWFWLACHNFYYKKRRRGKHQIICTESK